VSLAGGITPVLAALREVYREEGFAGAISKARIAMSRDEVTRGYQAWINEYDTLSECDRERIQDRVASMDSSPLISIVMPTYNTKIEWFEKAIQSVRSQLYENWELCIADDASTDKELLRLLRDIEQEDARIKVVFREENGHISNASNSALQLCTGDWIALLDHDDLLAEHALYCVAEAIARAPDTKLIFSDEDKIAADGKRYDPYFKPDWNRDLFYSHNLISHLGVYRRELIDKIGGFRAGFEGSQDYDLALRCIELIDESRICHIPRVLYHWRAHNESTAQHVGAKPYATVAAQKALQEHFDRRGIAARVESLSYGYRVRYSLPTTLPLVSLVIPTRNALNLLRNCIQSISEKTSYPNYEILIVDNGSDDPATLQYLSALGSKGNIRVLRDDGPFNFSRINNRAVQHARGTILGFVNDDVEVISAEWLSELVGIALQPGVGAVGAKLLYPDDSVQHAGVVLGIGGVGSHAFKYQSRDAHGYFGRARLISSYSALTAACMVIEKEIFEEVGGFDEDHLGIAFNDVDLCLRVRGAGYRNVFTPYALLYHHESASRGTDDEPEKQARFNAEINHMHQRWGNILLRDPAYSANLTLNTEDFDLAWPPRVERIATVGQTH